MSGDDERHIARGMYAKDGEYVEFVEKCECSGHVSSQDFLTNITFHYGLKVFHDFVFFYR